MASNRSSHASQFNTSDATDTKEAFDKVIAEFRDLTSAFDELVATGTASAERLTELRDRATEKVSEAKDMVSDLADDTMGHARQIGEKTTAYVRQNPWTAATIGIGVIAGLLLTMRKK